MRIITWNVNCLNKKILKLLKFALDQKPDILCLQEVPYKALEYLQNLQGYHLSYAFDFQNRYMEKNAYICTLSLAKPIHTEEIQYFHHTEHSILNRIIYQKILHNHEKHNAIAITIQQGTNSFCVVNARLSCAVGTRERLKQFKHIINNLPAHIAPIICGDMNISDSKLFQYATGWLRGFTKQDYRLNERDEFEILFDQHNFINMFRGMSTSLVNRPLLQFDHILIPKTTEVLDKRLSKSRFGSDHKMLLADIQI